MNKHDVKPQIEDGWKIALNQEFGKDYFKKLKESLLIEKSKYTIYPPGKEIFSDFKLTPL